MQDRERIQRILSQADPNYTIGHYFRLMALAGMELFISLPLQVYVICFNVSNVHPWISWDDTHSSGCSVSIGIKSFMFEIFVGTTTDFSRVDQYPALFWRSNARIRTSLETRRWFSVCIAIIFFAFFGFSDGVWRNYGRMFESVAKHIGLRYYYEKKPKGRSMPVGVLQVTRNSTPVTAAVIRATGSPRYLFLNWDGPSDLINE